ncbi:MAG: glycerol-3-phosphate dehydrogenase/oxidase [Candidatus Nanopelagicaceae bacterium]|nr:glycerol-3-phosphate dehydrogenase/oxidase [Candidatus Nanopelagicaceae bacterium]
MFDSSLNPQQRAEDLSRLAKEHFDVLVIGGGINGVGVALDAVTRGLTVALVEGNDFASGTSSRSSKLIHGGLRYLEQYDFKLVREALHERELLVSSLAPHLVKPVAFLYPLHEKVKERTYVGAGLALYDALRGFKRALPGHKHLSQKTISEIAPSLRTDVVTGAIRYFDAQVDDARHTMMIARTAKRHGAAIITHAKVDSLIKKGKRVTGAVVADLDSKKKINVKASTVIMCAGVWSDQLHKSFGIEPGYEVKMSKGVHITLPGNAIKADEGIIIKTAVSVLFIIPWKDQWMIGTTDTEYLGDPNEPLADRSDVQYIIEQANRVLSPRISTEQVIGVFAGLRPLVANKKDVDTTKLSREHTVDRPVPGFVSLAGGKYTTYRVMAKDAVDMATNDITKLTNESVTSKLPIIGADGYWALTQQVDALAARYNLKSETLVHLLNRYGSDISDLLELISEDRKLATPVSRDLPYLKAEIVYSVMSEGAQTVADVMERRTRIWFEAPNFGLDLAQSIADLIAPHLKWKAPQKKASIAEYVKLVECAKESAANLTKI